MRVEQVSAVLAVLATGSFSRAARELGIGTSTLSESVRALERELGAPLLRRSPRGVSATEVGRAAQPALQRLVAAAEEIADVVASGPARRLRVGAVTAAVTTVLADATADLLGTYPGLELRVRAAGSAEITSAVAAGDLDAGLVITTAGGGSPALATVPLLTCPLGVVVPAGHRLAGSSSPVVEPADIAEERLVIHRAGYLVHDLVGALLPAAQVAHRADNTETAKAMVAAGVGIAVLPELSVTDRDREGLVWRPLAGAPGAVTVALVHIPSPGAAVEAFREVLVGRAATHPAAHSATPDSTSVRSTV